MVDVMAGLLAVTWESWMVALMVGTMDMQKVVWSVDESAEN